jgi:hypothetical protein
MGEKQESVEVLHPKILSIDPQQSCGMGAGETRGQSVDGTLDL